MPPGRRAASASACPCRPPRRGRRSRRRGGRATRAGPGRCRPRRRGRAGRGRRRRRRAGRRPGSARPARRRSSSRRRGRSSPAAPRGPPSSQPARDRLAGAQRDVVLGGAAAAETTATLILLLRSSVRRRAALADDDRDLDPGSTSEPGGGNWSVTRPTLAGDFGFLFFTVGLSPASRERFHRFGAQLADHVRHRRLFFALGDDDRDGRARRRPALPALGDWRITCPAGAELSSSSTLGVEAAAADLLHRDRALGADQDRHLGQLRAAGDREHVTVEPLVAVVPPPGSEWITSPSSTLVGVDPLRPATSKPASSSLSVASASAGPAVEGTLALPGPALTVSVTFGFEQKKLRKEQSSEASPAARRVLLEHRVRRALRARPASRRRP